MAMNSRVSAIQRRRRVKKNAQSMNGQQMTMYVARSFWLWKTLVTA